MKGTMENNATTEAVEEAGKMTLAELRASGRIMYEFVAGSHLYGLSVPTSDLDIRGYYWTPKAEYISLDAVQPQVGDDDHDIVYYSLSRAFELLKTSNPNMLEGLFPSTECIRIARNPLMAELFANRHLFVSKKIYYTHAGYSAAQIKKARGCNKRINNPMPKDPPKKEDFCWIIDMKDPNNFSMPFDGHDVNKFPCRPVKLAETTLNLQEYHASSLEHVPDVFRLYHYEDGKGVFRGNEFLTCASIPKEDEKKRFRGFLIFNEVAYKQNIKEWKQYNEWFEKRNESRWIDQEKGLLNYDCYLSEKTDFLTKDGWKGFEDITENDWLATIDTNHGLVYQKFTDRFSKEYSGKIYTYENRYTRFSVTGNHKLFVSDCHRSSKNNFSTAYDKEISNWGFLRVSDFMSSRRSHKHIIVSLLNNKKDADISDDEIKLMGAYLSEGSIYFNHKHKPMAIYISQLEHGKMCSVMDSIKEYKIAKTVHFRKGRNEFTYRIQDSELASKFLNLMGHGCRKKKLPVECMDFSTRQAILLLDTMVCGDGHKHCKGHTIYYSTSRRLIKDLQLLLFANGVSTQVYLYGQKTHQLFVPKVSKQHVAINKDVDNKRRALGWKTKNVTKKKVVCFSVPSGLLITRNNNKIAVQGNSKNMMHCMRLMLSAEHALRYGAPLIRFDGELQKYLMRIRAGEFEYEEIMAKFKEKEKELKKFYNESTLPEDVDHEKINMLYKHLMDIGETMEWK